MFACAPSVTRHDASNLTVGILNEFPDTPNYIKKRTFVFRHKVACYGTDGFKNILTQSAKEYLISKGYKTKPSFSYCSSKHFNVFNPIRKKEGALTPKINLFR